MKKFLFEVPRRAFNPKSSFNKEFLEELPLSFPYCFNQDKIKNKIIPNLKSKEYDNI